MRVSSPTTGAPPVLDGMAAWKRYLAFFRDQVGTLADIHRQYGPMLVLRERMPWRQRVPQCVIVSGAELNRQVLGDTETYQSGGFSIRGPRGSAQNRLRKGLVGLNGEEHREKRRMVAPLFMPKAARQHYPQMTEVVRAQLDAWPVGQTIDVSERISRISLLISAQNLLAGEDLAEAIRLAEMTADLLKQGFSQSVWLFPVNLPGTPYWRLLKGAERLESQMLEMIEKRKPAAENSTHLLDRLISVHRENPERMSREDLVGQLVLLFGASHETTAKAVIWSIFLLAQHPRIMAELLEELVDRCGDQTPTIEELDELPLLDAVVNESMRLLPPVPWIAKRVRAEAQLGGLAVHPRDYVVLSIYSTHRDPKVFPQPEQFRPERWFDIDPDSHAYLPFSAGPRTCIAKTLGMVTIKMMVAMIGRRFRLTPVPRSRIDRTTHVTLAPKYGMPMDVALQDGQFRAVAVRGNLNQMVDLKRGDASTRARSIRIRSGAPSTSAARRSAAFLNAK